MLAHPLLADLPDAGPVETDADVLGQHHAAKAAPDPAGLLDPGKAS